MMTWLLLLLLSTSVCGQLENKQTLTPTFELISNLLNGVYLNVSVPTIHRLMHLLLLSNPRSEGYQCLKDLDTLMTAALNEEQWAKQMVDASAKIGNTLLKLNLMWPGSYFLCIKSTISKETIQSQYCWTEIDLGKLTLRVATCLPSTCNQHYLNEIVKLQEGGFFKKFICSSGRQSLWSDHKVTFSMFLCLILLTLLITGTALEVYISRAYSKKLKIESDDEIIPFLVKRNETERKRNQDLGFTVVTSGFPTDTKQSLRTSTHQILILFSAYSNGKKVVQMRNEKDSFPFLHGIRVLSLNWIILGHAFGKLSSLSDNPLDIMEMGKRKWIRFPIADYFALDVFQVLSGFLLTLLYLSTNQTIRKISWIKFFITYLLRVVPCFWFTFIVLHNGIYLRSDEERLYYDVPSSREECLKHWWSHLLFMSNYLEKPDKCFRVSWMLSLDVQFYLIAPLLLSFIFRYRRNTLIFGAIIFFGSCLITGMLSFVNGLQADYESDIQKYSHTHDKLFTKIYMKLYFRMSMYILAILFACLIHTRKICFTKDEKRILWFLCLFCMILPFLNPYYFVKNVAVSAWYLSTVHSIWALGLLLLIVICYNGCGGLLASILSWTGWLPLSRLCYSTFLVHYFIVELAFFSREDSCHFGLVSGFLYTAGVTIISYVAGLVLHLAIEAPISNVMKAIGLT